MRAPFQILAIPYKETGGEQCVWLPYAEAREKLKWDSNRTALYELHCCLEEK